MDSSFSFGPFTLVPRQRKLLQAGVPVRLGSRAFDILVALVESAGKVVSNAELIARVWPDTVVDPGALRVHIAGLRKALGDGRSGQRYVVNVPLQGYCFVADVVSTTQELSETRAASAPPTGLVQAASTISGIPAPNARPLPASVARPVGRGQTIAELTSDLATRRCVTLVGPGGMGKTTVAIEAAAEFAAKNHLQAIFVSLSSLSDPALVPSEVVSALGLPEVHGDPLVGAIRYLKDLEVLVVLDNCEHVIAAAAVLSEALLEGCSKVHILATSREPLRTHGEWVVRLRALSVPPEYSSVPAREMLEYSAVELFVERVRAVVDEFEITDNDAPLVSAVCRALDGIPLAIELAAARVEQIGLRGVAANLGNRLALLTRGRRTALPRHQTLRATFDWSYALLSEREKQLLQRLSIFKGRFVADAACAIAALPQKEPAEEDLFSLVSKSLVVTDVGAEQAQYWLLETTREYALGHLVASGDLEAVSRRHAHLMLELADEAVQARAESAAAPSATNDRHLVDDLRAAISWALAHKDESVLAASLAASAAPILFGASLMAEHLFNIDRALAALGDVRSLEPRRQLALLEAYGQALWHVRGDGRASIEVFETAEATAAKFGSHQDSLRINWGMWLVTNSLGDYKSSLRFARRFGEIALHRNSEGIALAHHRMMAMSLHLLGEHRGALQHAQHVLQATQASGLSARSDGYVFDHRVAALTTLSRVLWIVGKPNAALEHAELAVARAVQLKHSLSLCFALSVGAAPVSIWCGDWTGAQLYTSLLREHARALSMSLWQVFADGYELVLGRKRGSSTGTLATLRHPTRSLQDTLCTLDEGLADEAYFRRGDDGLAGWSEPELLRIRGNRQRAAGELRDAEESYRRSIELSQKQEAFSWQLRASCGLARLLVASSRMEDARDVLQSSLTHFDADATGSDLRDARTLLVQVNTQ